MPHSLDALPRLGIGLSAEPGSWRAGIDPNRLLLAHAGVIDFVEYGTDIERGLDESIREWTRAGHAATYHFLDLNLEERADLDEPWLERTLAAAREINAAWLCGDSGLWHLGARDRGHEVLLPPILCRDSALEAADTILALEARSGLRVLPENPPGAFYVGDMHLLDYYAAIAERTDGGLLLDCAHLAMYQALHAHDPLTGLDAFPLDRVIEIHVAGGTPFEVDGLHLVEDSHTPEPLPATWAITEYVVARAPRLCAIVYECEKNSPDDVIQNFARLRRLFAGAR